MQPLRKQADKTKRHALWHIVPAILSLFMGVSFAHASMTSGTIDSSYKFAWGSVAGWINLKPTTGGISVTDSAVSGYAWATNTGWINFSPSEGGVTNTSNGTLGGFAWDSGSGWISFSGVTIDTSGKFHGTATGTNYVINFDCANCDVRTDWRPFSVRPVPPNGAISPVYIPPFGEVSSTGNTFPITEPPAGQFPPIKTTGTKGVSSTVTSDGSMYRTRNFIPTTPLATSTKPIKKSAVASTTKPVSTSSFWRSIVPSVAGGVSFIVVLGFLWWVFFL